MRPSPGRLFGGAIVVALGGWALRQAATSTPGGILDAGQVQGLYGRIATSYDRWAGVYALFGGRRLQRHAIELLGLGPGDTVIDLGTGTGWNLPSLSSAVGPTGRVIGVDLTEEMLDVARARCDELGLVNVELVRADMRDYRLPDASAVIAGFAMEMIPEYDQLIGRLARDMPTGARLVVTGLREPAAWPEWAIQAGVLLMRPFGVTRQYGTIKPWTSVDTHFDDVVYRDILTGVIYLATGTAP